MPKRQCLSAVEVRAFRSLLRSRHRRAAEFHVEYAPDARCNLRGALLPFERSWPSILWRSTAREKRMTQFAPLPSDPSGRREPMAEMHVVWLTAGLGCDGDTIAVTGATQPSIEDIVLAPSKATFDLAPNSLLRPANQNAGTL